MSALLLLLCLAAGAAAPGGAAAWEDAFGVAPVAHVTGNGQLTLGLDGRGCLTNCRWPSPSHQEHLHRFGAAGPPAGWFVADEQGLRRLFAAPWQVQRQQYLSPESVAVRTEARFGAGGGPRKRAVQTCFADVLRDIAVLRLELEGYDQAPRVYWWQDFQPATRHVPQVPAAYRFWEGSRDFAAFVLPGLGRFYQFRPAVLPDAWESGPAGEAAPGGAQGTWIAGAVSPALDAGWCGLANTPRSAQGQLRVGDPGTSAVHGDADTAVQFRTPSPNGQGAFIYDLFLAFAATRAEADALLDEALDQGFAGLLARTETRWAVRLRHGRPETVVRFEAPSQTPDLRVLLLGIAQRGGGLVRGAAAQPPLHFCDAPTAAWASAALDSAGLRDEASRILQFMAANVRARALPAQPRGSLPLGVYSDGTPFWPHAATDATHAAWLLTACARHLPVLGSAQRRAFLTTVWPAVRGMGDFLAGWSAGGEGRPLHSFDAAYLRDRRSHERTLLIHAGMRAAVRIAEQAGEEPGPLWNERVTELDTLLRFTVLNDPAPWRMPPEWAWWLRAHIEPEHPVWRVPVLPGWAPVEEAAQGVPLAEVPFPDVPSLPPLPWPDSMRAALRYLSAAQGLYAGPAPKSAGE